MMHSQVTGLRYCLICTWDTLKKQSKQSDGCKTSAVLKSIKSNKSPKSVFFLSLHICEEELCLKETAARCECIYAVLQCGKTIILQNE